MYSLLVRIFLAVFLFSSFSGVFAGNCSWNEGSTIGTALSGCTPKGSITIPGDDYKLASGVKGKVVKITNQIILAGSILSVGGIVFSSIMYTTAFGSDDRIKKAKESLKFSIMGFVVMLLSFPLVNAIINLIYSVSAG